MRTARSSHVQLPETHDHDDQMVKRMKHHEKNDHINIVDPLLTKSEDGANKLIYQSVPYNNNNISLADPARPFYECIRMAANNHAGKGIEGPQQRTSDRTRKRCGTNFKQV